MLGLGAERIRRVPADDQAHAARGTRDGALRARGPRRSSVSQAGEINTGAFDPIDDMSTLCRTRRWWDEEWRLGWWGAASRPYHARGLRAFGSWRPIPTSAQRADRRWSARDDPFPLRHRWLRRRLHSQARDVDLPWGSDWTPQFRGAPVACRSMRAALAGAHRPRQSDRRLLRSAVRMANRLGEADGVDVLERRRPQPGSRSIRRRRSDHQPMIERAQQDGTCWLGGSSFRGRAVMRVPFVDCRRADGVDIAGGASSRPESKRSSGGLERSRRLHTAIRGKQEAHGSIREH